METVLKKNTFSFWCYEKWNGGAACQTLNWRLTVCVCRLYSMCLDLDGALSQSQTTPSHGFSLFFLIVSWCSSLSWCFGWAPIDATVWMLHVFKIPSVLFRLQCCSLDGLDEWLQCFIKLSKCLDVSGDFCVFYYSCIHVDSENDWTVCIHRKNIWSENFESFASIIWWWQLN